MADASDVSDDLRKALLLEFKSTGPFGITI
jgi:hypothetical protein